MNELSREEVRQLKLAAFDYHTAQIVANLIVTLEAAQMESEESELLLNAIYGWLTNNMNLPIPFGVGTISNLIERIERRNLVASHPRTGCKICGGSWFVGDPANHNCLNV